ncbi:RodZ domain-containing protein [Pelomonas sp. SE-A7]|uniref:helix-turn-helix domain-containing protein n=1 Tax=Pelomonas sp. SE-A7 TaxID=3054953 RepID=UPI00259C71E0|nr:RodZ domain-containing protein [Pelomonas sp. SE-A7]MDM4767391.1 DUF4115 domain-containing protein [Pelomonas sp. SE-A7]
MESTVGEAPTTAPAPRTAGAWLRQVRQAQGMHIAVLAATLKVPQSKLEAIEADRYQDLSDPTFVRALAQAMCRALKVDAATVLELLPRVQDPGLERVSRGLNQPFRERATRDETLSLDILKRPVVWGPLLLLLAAAAVYLMPSSWLEQFNRPAATEVAAPDTTASAPTPVLLEPAASQAVTLPAQAASEAAIRADLPAASAPAPGANASPAPVAGQVPLRVKATADTWIEVIDAQGQVLLSKLLRSGEVSELSVQTPVKVRIGNVAGTQLSLRGVSVDLAAQSSNNVARLELN